MQMVKQMLQEMGEKPHSSPLIETDTISMQVQQNYIHIKTTPLNEVLYLDTSISNKEHDTFMTSNVLPSELPLMFRAVSLHCENNYGYLLILMNSDV